MKPIFRQSNDTVKAPTDVSIPKEESVTAVIETTTSVVTNTSSGDVTTNMLYKEIAYSSALVKKNCLDYSKFTKINTITNYVNDRLTAGFMSTENYAGMVHGISTFEIVDCMDVINESTVIKDTTIKNRIAIVLLVAMFVKTNNDMYIARANTYAMSDFEKQYITTLTGDK